MPRTVRMTALNDGGIYLLLSDHSLWQLLTPEPSERPEHAWSQVDLPWPKFEQGPGPLVLIFCPPVSHRLYAVIQQSIGRVAMACVPPRANRHPVAAR